MNNSRDLSTGVSRPPPVCVEGLAKRYGGVTALSGIDLEVAEGSIVGIIGPNGAGKSTLFDLLNGIIVPTEGRVTVYGIDLAKLRPHQVAALGVARTFQRTAVFAESSVFENLAYGRYLHCRHSLLSSLFRTRRARGELADLELAAASVMDLAGLPPALRDVPAGTLAYGQQRRLAIAIALMSEPKLLLLDEPAAGMNTQEKEDLVRLLKKVSVGRTLLIVEHDMSTIETLCDHVLVLNDGRVVVSDRPDRVFAHPEVIAAYLGTDDE